PAAAASSAPCRGSSTGRARRDRGRRRGRAARRRRTSRRAASPGSAAEGGRPLGPAGCPNPSERCVLVARRQPFPARPPSKRCSLAPSLVSTAASGSRQVPPDLVRELADPDRLLEVAVEAVGEKPLAVALHRRGGECDHADRGRALVLTQLPHRLSPLHVGHADVHQDEIGAVFDSEGEPLDTARGFERSEPCELENVAREPPVLLVVVDDQDQLVGHRDASSSARTLRPSVSPQQRACPRPRSCWPPSTRRPTLCTCCPTSTGSAGGSRRRCTTACNRISPRRWWRSSSHGSSSTPTRPLRAVCSRSWLRRSRQHSS